MRQLTHMPLAASITAPALPVGARRRLSKLCVAIQGASPEGMIERAGAALKDAKFFEFRLDSLPKPATALPLLNQFLTRNREVTAIATCRRKQNGGNFAGALAAELDLLAKAAQAGCQIVDLEVESAEEAKPAQLAKLRAAGAALMVSFHDFMRTRSLEAAADRIAVFKPDYVKVVSTARSLADNLAILRLIEDRSLSAHVVAIAMGEEGIVSRVLGVRAGAAFTFASFSDGTETAPGQVAVRTLLDMYRVEHLDQATRVFGVAGNPIAHSLSPLMQNTAFRRENVNAVLLPLKVRTLADLLTLTQELPLAGVAVTMPLNTDVAGIVRPLEKRLRLKGARIAVLGAGGAARAAVFGLVDQGAEVFVVNRTHEHAVTLARQAKAKSLKHELFAKQHFNVLINATPCGMKGAKQTLPIAENELNADLVFDMVYNPLETPLLALARARGIPVIGGVEMFVQQGARQFEIWTGKPAPETEMLRVVEHELRKRG